MLYNKNRIALVDCNSFYVSCERLFNPSIIKKPVIVLSSNDGCVISRSDEAKALGIKMGEPYFKVEKIVKKNNVKIFSSNYSLYGDVSRRVMKTLKKFSPQIEIYSIDEAFLNLSLIKDEDLIEYGNEIRKTVDFLDEDRPLFRDHDNMKSLVQNCSIIKSVEDVIGALY